MRKTPRRGRRSPETARAPPPCAWLTLKKKKSPLIPNHQKKPALSICMRGAQFHSPCNAIADARKRGAGFSDCHLSSSVVISHGRSPRERPRRWRAEARRCRRASWSSRHARWACESASAAWSSERAQQSTWVWQGGGLVWGGGLSGWWGSEVGGFGVTLAPSLTCMALA